ncbi:unnamed protein product [Lepeophtheirus salmonis]|uniref:(salmon louse) hypothetical protein n=1 Tax=Lepeophtheirus salmonis TaxID=72036 RepID=A0A7R8CHR6_LEPSM|nr:unnamed protein product [Lepeophtheirus salmonis]CAF2826308.1 unnamed protein product [Lepeophtheirus salmonis]
MDLNLHGEKVEPPETWFDRGFWKIFARGRIHLKQKNAQVCSMRFNDGSYKRDLEHELLNLTPRKRLNTDAVPSLLLPTPTVPKPEVQCDKKFPKSYMNQHSLKLPPAVSIIKVKTKSAGGDNAHLGAVGAMKRMRILEIWEKKCETLVNNPAVQIEKEYDIYRIEDEEEKESVTRQITGDILDITIVHVDFAINYPLDQFKKWDLNIQGLSYGSSFIAHKMKLLYPDLGKKTSDIYLNEHGYIICLEED